MSEGKRNGASEGEGKERLTEKIAPPLSQMSEIIPWLALSNAVNVHRHNIGILNERRRTFQACPFSTPWLCCLHSLDGACRASPVVQLIVLQTNEHNDSYQSWAAFFKSFRIGFVVCRGLDANLSGKVAKKTTLTRKSGRHAHNVCLP